VTRSGHETFVHRVRKGAARALFSVKGSGLYNVGRGIGSSVDLLVSDEGRFSLVNVSTRGKVATTWSISGTPRSGRWARGADGRTVIAWTDRRDVLRVVSGVGRRFGRPRRVDLQLQDGGYVDDLEIDAAGHAAVALGDYEQEFFATLDAAGSVLDYRRMGIGATYGHVEVSDAGRVAMLVDDTGSESLDDHECVAGEERSISVVLRAPTAVEIDRPTEIDKPPWACFQAEATLVSGQGDRFAALWGLDNDGGPPQPKIRVAFAGPGQPFGPPVTPWKVKLRDAVFDQQGGLIVTATSPTEPSEQIVEGQFVVEELDASGAVAPEHVLAESAGFSILAMGDDGKPVVAWRDRPGRWSISRGS
jgi:hypothetical protein